MIQKDYYRRYGTTMRGMMTEHGVRADDYLAYVHKIDHSPLEPNPAMGAAIARLPGRKLILTNGSTDHASAVLARLGIGEHFEAVFDIIAAELEPKPAPQTYRKFLGDHGVNPATSAMFEDLARNLVVPHQLGMITVLVVPDGSKEVVREDWELEGRDDAHVDHVTDDLTGFLQKVAIAEQLFSPCERGTYAGHPFGHDVVPSVREHRHGCAGSPASAGTKGGVSRLSPPKSRQKPSKSPP